jgi:hypothetical protein
MITTSSLIIPNSTVTNINNTVKPVDTLAPMSMVAKDGYYVVGKNIFKHKVCAMQEATRLGIAPNQVEWVFNNDVFSSVDWKTPSDLPLSEWYRLRAQQLREKYSYLVLAFSGGGDSANMLDSFVLNNIHLDEVVVHWPRHLTAGKYKPSMSSDVTNYSSEWDYLVEPKLKWLAKVAPRTKISILDNMTELRPEEPDENIVKLSVRHTWNGIKRYEAWDELLLDRQHRYKNCAMLLGVSPPTLIKKDRHVFTYLTDNFTCFYNSDYTDQGLQRNVEFFYWTPDMPELVREQAHACLKNLQLHKHLLYFIGNWSPGNIKTSGINKLDREDYRRWMKSVLYPTYDSKQLQVDKVTSSIYRPEWFSWFYDNPHSDEIWQPHASAVMAHQKLINPDFFQLLDGNVVNYVSYYSKLYHIGDVT